MRGLVWVGVGWGVGWGWDGGLRSFPFDVVFAEAFAGSANFLQAMRAVRLLKLVRLRKWGWGENGGGWFGGLQFRTALVLSSRPMWVDSACNVCAARPAVLRPGCHRHQARLERDGVWRVTVRFILVFSK